MTDGTYPHHHLYRAYGLSLESDVPLAGLPRSTDATANADCRVRFRKTGTSGTRAIHPHAAEWLHKSRRPNGRVWIAVGRRGPDYAIRFPGMAEFGISADGREVRARRARGVPLRTLRHLLLDHVLPRVLDLKGALVLHAATIATDAGAVVFLGRSGQGKSTLTASLARAGFAVLGDDVIVLREIAGAWHAVPSHPGLRLWPDSAALLESSASTGPVAHHTNKQGGDAARMGAWRRDSPVPIARAYVLAPADASELPAVVALSTRDVFARIVAQTFRFDPGASCALRDELRTLTRLAAAPWFRTLVVPRDYAALPGVRACIERDLSTGRPS